MAVNQDTVIKIALSENDLSSCIDNTQILCETISDRSDLHLRSYMERYIDIMMGEVAEAAVIILDTFTIATKASELRKVNIQVYYWLKLKGENRITVPSNKNMAIIGWIGENDVKEFGTYNTENRQVAKIKLRNIRTMKSLLDYLE